jgi:hypothetical protein
MSSAWLSLMTAKPGMPSGGNTEIPDNIPGCVPCSSPGMKYDNNWLT